jgi:hypothetical protein
MREALEGGYAPEESKNQSKKIAVSASVAESEYVIETKEIHKKGKGPKNFNKKNNDSTSTEMKQNSKNKAKFSEIIKQAESNFPELPGFSEKTD